MPEAPGGTLGKLRPRPAALRPAEADDEAKLREFWFYYGLWVEGCG